MEDLPVVAGALIAGKYRVERLLGDGGMGVVVSAVHVKLGERRAIKMMRPAIAVNPEATRRFLREAQAAARLRSEHVAKVYDVDEADGVPIMIMEYLEGADLAAVLSADGPLAVGEAALYMMQTCEALAEAHAAGLVHRDIKPSNLFLTRRPDGSPAIKVLDFGIAKAVMQDDVAKRSAMTAQGLLLGTAHYMSPEQMNGESDIDARTDIWSLGVTLYELCTGRLPFDAGSIMKLFALITDGPPAPMGESAPGVPAALEALVLHCLQKDRAARPASALELSELLRPFLPEGAARSFAGRELVSLHRRVSAPTEAVPAASAKQPTSLDMEMDTASQIQLRREEEPGAHRPEAPSGARRWLISGAAAAAFALGMTGAILALRQPAAAPPAPARPSTSAASDPAPPTARAAEPPPRVEPGAAAPTNAAPTASPSASAAPPAPAAKPHVPVVKPAPTASPAAPKTPSRTEVNIP
jgi:serine/threonine-protein kinase